MWKREVSVRIAHRNAEFHYLGRSASVAITSGCALNPLSTAETGSTVSFNIKETDIFFPTKCYIRAVISCYFPVFVNGDVVNFL